MTNLTLQALSFPRVPLTDGSEFSQCTTGLHRDIAGAFYPQSTAEVQAIVHWANQAQAKLWPVSTGNNWGYGSALPVTEHCYIVYLGQLKAIRDFNPDTGTVTVEPGVTQRMLYEFLQNSSYICPTTGAGPDTSILGNLLERGYGLAPTQDHFSSLVSLQAIWGNGELYESPLNGLAGAATDQCFKWGIGPYLDGLFSQSNLGIVTEVTIQLAKAKPHQRLVRLAIEDDQLSPLVDVIQQLLQDYDGILSGINLMNRERVEAMGVTNVPDWTGIFAVSGATKAIVDSAFRSIKSQIKKYCSVLSVNTRFLTVLKKLSLPTQLQHHVQHASAVHAILNGEPTTMALNLAYLHNKSDVRSNDPARDNCGLIWYTPLVPMHKEAMDAHIANIKKHCKKYDLKPLITFTSLGGKCFDSSVPLLFDKSDKHRVTAANTCFMEMLANGREQGLFPYRLPISAMRYLQESNPVFFSYARRLKQTFDPMGVISPGRYCPE